MADRTREIARTLSDQAFGAFVAMTPDEQSRFSERLNLFYHEVGHSQALRWTLTPSKSSGADHG